MSQTFWNTKTSFREPKYKIGLNSESGEIIVVEEHDGIIASIDRDSTYNLYMDLANVFG